MTTTPVEVSPIQARAEGFYDVSGFVRVAIGGSSHPVGRVMDETLALFRSESVDPDLKIVLDEYPSATWEPSGFTVGDRLLFDFDTEATTVFHSPTSSTLPKGGVEYVIVGDFRRADSRVTVYVPSLPGRDSYLRSIQRGLSRRSFARTLLALFRSKSYLKEPIEFEAAKLRLAILEPFLYYRLPARGATLVHGSVVSSGDSGLMFTGGGHIGKTALSLEMVKRGYSYMGDDLSMLGENGLAYPYPEPVRIQQQHLALFPDLEPNLSKRMGRGERFLFRRLVGVSPSILELMPRMPISEVVNGATTGRSCKLDNLLLIRKGAKHRPILEEIDLASTVGAMKAELLWEFEAGHWRHNQYLYAPSCARGADFLEEEEEHRKAVGRIMTNALRNTRTFKLQVPYEFRITDAVPFVDKVLRK